MERKSNRYRWIVLGSIVVSRIVYAISWFDIAASPLAIKRDFNVNLSALGPLASAFTVGVGLFQIPAGGLAARWGAKKTAMFGLAIMAVAGVLSGVAPSFSFLILSRFLVGLGAAFFFAPAIGIITPMFNPEERGFVIGVYNGAFGIGAGIGLFGWALLDEAVGWRFGLMLAGILTAILAFENQLVIRDTPPSQVMQGSVRAVMKSRSIWFWGVGLLGFWGALYTASSFLQDFGETQLALNPFQAGLLSSSINFVAVLGGPIGGKLSDHFSMRKVFMLVPGVIFGFGIMTVGYLGLPSLWLVPAGLGFIDGFIFAALYASPSQLPEVGPRYAPLAIGLINGIQILGSFWIPITFAILAQSSGYSTAWLFLGVAALVFLPLVALTREPFSHKPNPQGRAE
jgi:MFS family permease